MSAAQSPLFEPVVWHDGGFKILDEIQVPQKIDYIEVTEVGQALDAVREMKTRAFGQVLTFLYSAALVAQHYHSAEAAPLREQLQQLTQRFCDARPTFDFRGLGAFVDGFFEKLPAGADVGATIATRGARVRPANHARPQRPGQAHRGDSAQPGAAADALQYQRRVGRGGRVLQRDGQRVFRHRYGNSSLLARRAT